MLHLAKGVKAGFFSGAWHGAVLSIYLTLTALPLLDRGYRLPIILGVLGRAILSGMLLGALFAVSYTSIPFRNPIPKGILFSLLYSLAAFLVVHSFPFLAVSVFGVNVLISLLFLGLLDGFVLGYMWDRLPPTTPRSSDNT